MVSGLDCMCQTAAESGRGLAVVQVVNGAQACAVAMQVS